MTSERVVQFRVGVVVLATLIITAILVLLFGELPSLVQGSYTVYVTFPDAPGVSADSPVRKSGILIGRVHSVELEEDGVLVTLTIQGKYRLKKTDRCQIKGSLLGDSMVQFVSDRQPVMQQVKKQPAEVVEDELQEGDLIPGEVASDPLQVIGNLEESLSDAIGSVSRTSDEIGELARRVTGLLESNDEQISRIVDKAEASLDQISAAAESTNRLLSDPVLTENLRKSINDLPVMISETRQAIGGIKGTLQSAERNLQNIEGLTKPLGEKGEQLINNLDSATGRLDEVLTELSVFSRSLNDPNGTVGQLVNNPELYHRLSDTISNVEELSRDLKPILRDARVFSDKIARHPELIGVRGALKPSSGLK